MTQDDMDLQINQYSSAQEHKNPYLVRFLNWSKIHLQLCESAALSIEKGLQNQHEQDEANETLKLSLEEGENIFKDMEEYEKKSPSQRILPISGFNRFSAIPLSESSERKKIVKVPHAVSANQPTKGSFVPSRNYLAKSKPGSRPQ